ncbi:GtrA family protein [Haloquadratum walsbyi]|jgi:putative flippase GtrA|uniref:Putative membrane protein n=1 Tax=Haloquadratum walsbyi J07HQW2 TaxID=1238425 RepID=U1NHP3_9EURY|nr:GtrA family protein [Haloquadratum walsbyi]ERG96378.1 MAG: putative membrane protein [Haloquadratum walsbyi J07HQW2]
MDWSRGIVDALFSRIRFGKFVSVGALGAVFDIMTTTALIVIFDLLDEYAKLVGAEIAIIVMFAVNERWTFADIGSPGVLPTISRFIRSNLVRSGGLAVQFVIVRALRQLEITIIIAGFDIWQLIPIPIAIASSLGLNYIAESLLTWRVIQS